MVIADQELVAAGGLGPSARGFRRDHGWRAARRAAGQPALRHRRADALDAACAQAGFTPRIVFEASALPMVVHMAAGASASRWCQPRPRTRRRLSRLGSPDRQSPDTVAPGLAWNSAPSATPPRGCSSSTPRPSARRRPSCRAAANPVGASPVGLPPSVLPSSASAARAPVTTAARVLMSPSSGTGSRTRPAAATRRRAYGSCPSCRPPPNGFARGCRGPRRRRSTPGRRHQTRPARRA